MKNRVLWELRVKGLTMVLLLSATSAIAHHTVQAKFNLESPVELAGIVTAVDWANPHVHIFMNVEDESGDVLTNWAIELESPIELEWSGWKPEDLKPGTTIRVEGYLARNGTDQAWGDSITTGGKPVFVVDDDVFEAQAGEPLEGPVPNWPDGQPRLGPVPGQSGYWALPSSSSLIEDGVNVTMGEYGLLDDIEDAERVAPFQTWAKDLYVFRQSNFLKDDPLFNYCIPPGGPRHFQLPFGLQLAEQRERDRIFVLIAGGNRNWRLIYTDGREQVGSIGGNDTNPLFYGRSVAEWEGDTLLIDTIGFNERFWFSNGGLPHTSQLHLIERISRPDINTLNYEVIVDDPGAYTRPWTSTMTLRWVADKEMPEYYCQDNRP